MEKAEAYDERFEEVGWGHTTCEGGEQGSASFCGVAGGKGLNQGESGLPKHVPNPVSGKRATGGGPDTESFCRQSPEVGAGWFNDHVRICAGGAQQCAFLRQQRGVRRNLYSYRNRMRMARVALATLAQAALRAPASMYRLWTWASSSMLTSATPAATRLSPALVPSA